jgi:hypothetical protein
MMQVQSPLHTSSAAIVSAYLADSVNSARTHEVSRAWRAVFGDSARASQGEVDTKPSNASRTRTGMRADSAPDARDRPDLAQPFRDANFDANSGTETNVRLDSSSDVENAARARLNSTSVLGKPDRAVGVYAATPPVTTVIEAATANCCLATRSDRQDASPVLSAPLQLGPSFQVPEQESINISIKGLEISVTVRDADVTEEIALRSAFEVARHVVGYGGALRQLTLNGRTLYRHAEGTATKTKSAKYFAC